MFRYLNAGFRIIALAIAAVLVLAINYPLWTALALLCFYLIGRHQQMLDARRRLATDPLMLSPIEYEHYCADLLRQAGWTVSTTPRQDQGVDVVAVLRGVRVAIQAKRWHQRVGNHAVMAVVAGRAMYGAQVCVVVAPCGYTSSARALAARNGCLLLHHSQLPQLATRARIP